MCGITSPSTSKTRWKKNLTWDLLRSSPDCDEYVPMKYGGFFSDPEVQQKKNRSQRFKASSRIPEERRKAGGQTCVLPLV